MIKWYKKRRLLKHLERDNKEEMIAILIIMEEAQKKDEYPTDEEVINKMVKAGYSQIKSAVTFQGLLCLGFLGDAPC